MQVNYRTWTFIMEETVSELTFSSMVINYKEEEGVQAICKILFEGLVWLTS